MKIVIGADFVPTKTNMEIFENADINLLLGEELSEVLRNAKYRIFNLEVPLIDKEILIDKNGPCLYAKTKTIKLFKKLNVNLLTIANNHIMDQGIEGYKSTTELLNKNNISYVGGGNNIEEASKPYVFKFNNKLIGIYACAEHEFSIAQKDKPGANPFDPYESFDHISKLKENCDYLIVLYHGGKEHYRYPSPLLQKTCRKFIDKGANLVICQHSHCIGCEEKYNNETIIYGQGNFLFDDENIECWNTGLLVEINENFKINYIPIIKVDNTVRMAKGKQAIEILEQYYERSRKITLNGFIEKEYCKVSQDQIYSYLWRILNLKNSFLFRVINKISKYRFYKSYIEKKYTKNNILQLINYFECEAHREIIIEGLKHLNNRKE